MRRLIVLILLVALLIYSIYMAYSQPRAPVVVVRPQQAQPDTQTTASPFAQAQLVPTLASCNAIYLKIGNTQLCGVITSVFYTTTGYQITMISGWISGQFIIVTPPTCSISTTGNNIVNIPCEVEVLIPTRPIEDSITKS